MPADHVVQNKAHGVRGLGKETQPVEWNQPPEAKLFAKRQKVSIARAREALGGRSPLDRNR